MLAVFDTFEVKRVRVYAYSILCEKWVFVLNIFKTCSSLRTCVLNSNMFVFVQYLYVYLLLSTKSKKECINSFVVKGNLEGSRHVGDQLMLVTLWWWLFLDVGDPKSMLMTFLEMSVTIQSVTNITRRKNTMLVTLNVSWWHFFVCWCQLSSLWTITLTLIPNPNSYLLP